MSMTTSPKPLMQSERDLGLVLTGGGARGAYQVGVLRWIARHYPDLQVPIITGVSAGAVNTAKLASHPGTFAQAVDEMTHLWSELKVDNVFRVDAPSLVWKVARMGLRLVSGGLIHGPKPRAFLDTAPLQALLEESLAPVNGELTGIDYNLMKGKLSAVAIITTSYTTGQTVVWVKGNELKPWTRPQRRTEMGPITIDHIMASSALPIFFPAIRIGNEYYGDGGIRLAAPLSPALHLGADRILAISTRYEKSKTESDTAAVVGYPPPAQVLGVLLNAVFLDLIDQDSLRLEMVNHLVEKMALDKRDGMRPISFLNIRPTQDLGALAKGYEDRLPRLFRFMLQGLGTSEQKSPDVLSMLLFEPDYLNKLMALGEADAERRGEELHKFLHEELTPDAVVTKAKLA